MATIILLDTGPLSKIAHPKIDPSVRDWLEALSATDVDIRIPEIADYVILAAQADVLAQGGAPVVVATTNVGHLTRFTTAQEWSTITPASLGTQTP